MKKLLAIVTLAAIIMASPALAQSYDPDIGSGNIAPGGQQSILSALTKARLDGMLIAS